MTKLDKDRLIVECGCTDPEHLLVFQYYKDEAEEDSVLDIKNGFWDEMYVSFMSNCHWGFWRRLKIGIKYIFFKESYITGDCVIFNHNNIEQLEEATAFLKERIRKGTDAIVEAVEVK